ncbi:MAG: glycine cleavage system aminomethyltransferase GcvT [Thermodesulfobacteriota bacterium]
MVEKHTPLYNIHRELGARMVTFAGWRMPVQYTGVAEEHLAVRNAVGLFDVSHMGEIEVSGPQAMESIEYLTTNKASMLSPGGVQYTILCYDNGGVVDDVILYKLSDNRFLFCVNASNIEKDYNWIRERVGNKDVEVENRSDSFAQFALQGPFSEPLLQKLCKEALSQLNYYRFIVCDIKGVPSIVSRTGYTGEDGFEIYIPAETSQEIWKKLLKKGEEYSIKPCGLGARDTLRQEMCYPLYGHELKENINPLEAGLGWVIKFDKGSFVGKEALVESQRRGIKRRLIGLKMLDKGIPRADYRLFFEGKEVGYVTSGSMSPSLRIAIGIGFVESPFSNTNQEFFVEIRGRLARARVVKTPFFQPKKKRNLKIETKEECNNGYSRIFEIHKGA